MNAFEKRLLAPIALAWLAMFAVGLRFERPEFRAWEVVYRAETRRFRPERRVEMDGVGDLGYRSHLRGRQVARRTVFTTDAYGFRNPTPVPTPTVVVLGDSFAAGAGLSDDETLAARLSARLGVPIYSYATQYLNTPAMYLADQRFMARPPPIVIFAPVAREIAPRRLEYVPPTPLVAAPHEEIGDALRHWVLRVNEDNGLTRECRFAYGATRYALLDRPPEIVTPDGQAALVLSLEAQALYATPEERHIDDVVGWLAVMTQTFEARGSRLIVVPIPESGTIYLDRFPATERARVATPSFLDVLFERLEGTPVEAIDLRPSFERHRTPYLYQPDDSHWSPRAVALTAEVIASHLEGRPPP